MPRREEERRRTGLRATCAVYIQGAIYPVARKQRVEWTNRACDEFFRSQLPRVTNEISRFTQWHPNFVDSEELDERFKCTL